MATLSIRRGQHERPGTTAQVSEITGYRSIVVASQSITWLVGQLLKRCFAVDIHRPSGLFERPEGPEPLDLEAGPSWLRERTLDLHGLTRQRGGETP
jgi:hypothetical protein